MTAIDLGILLLGPVDARLGTASLQLGGPKQRAVLAMLALAAGRVVSMDRLIVGLWGDEPPATAANNVQVHVAALRKLLARTGRKDLLITQAPGYRLDTTVMTSDVARFDALRREAQHCAKGGNLPGASQFFSTALALWRGPALADLSTEPFAGPEATALEEQRLDTVDAFLHAELRQGRHSDVVGVTQTLLRQYPCRENLWAHHMLSLYRSGRQVEALEAFQRARKLLAEELGVDPGPALSELQARILRHDPSLAAEVERPTGGGRVDLSVCTSTVLRAHIEPQAARLVVSGGEVVPVATDDITIGRQSDCHLRLTDTDVSRRHARVRRGQGGHVVEDLGSTNGVCVNGVRVERMMLSHGDRIELGSTVLRYEIVAGQPN